MRFKLLQVKINGIWLKFALNIFFYNWNDHFQMHPDANQVQNNRPLDP